jgi:hypothetical protein
MPLHGEEKQPGTHLPMRQVSSGLQTIPTHGSSMATQKARQVDEPRHDVTEFVHGSSWQTPPRQTWL